MVESNKNKSLFLAIAAGTALVGAALLYHFVFADGDEGEASNNKLAEELKAAGLAEVKKAPNGAMLHPEYMLKLLNFVALNAKKRNETSRNEALKRRRECYTAENWDEYREIIKDQFNQEEQMMEKVLKDCLDILVETSEQEFQMTMQMMAQDQRFAQMIMAARQGKLPMGDEPAPNAAPKLERRKTLVAFERSKNLSMEAMRKQSAQAMQPTQGGDEMEMMVDVFVEQAKIEDALFIKEGITSDELEASIMHYMSIKDPEVTKAMQDYMMEMQKEMAKMQGGMPGMPGM